MMEKELNLNWKEMCEGYTGYNKKEIKMEIDILMNKLKAYTMYSDMDSLIGARATIDDLQAALDHLNNILIDEQSELEY